MGSLATSAASRSGLHTSQHEAIRGDYPSLLCASHGAHHGPPQNGLHRAATHIQVRALDRDRDIIQGHAARHEQLQADLHLALGATHKEHRGHPGHALQPRLDLVLDDAPDLVDRVMRDQHDPIDHLAATRAGQANHRLVGLLGQARHLVELVDYIHQARLGVEAVFKLQSDRTKALARGADYLGQALHTLEHFPLRRLPVLT